MTTVADLNIKVDVDGAASSAAELSMVGHAVDDVGDEAEGAEAKLVSFSSVMSGMKFAGIGVGLIGAAGGIGTLTSAAGGLVAALGGAGVAAGGIAAIGGTMAVAATQALKLKYGVDNVGDALAKLMQTAPIKKAMEGLNAEFRKLGDGVERFAQEVIPGAIEVFTRVVAKVGPFMEDIGAAISKELFQWAGYFEKAIGRILPHVADWMTGLSDVFQGLFKSLMPAMVSGMNGLIRVLAGLGKGLEAIVRAGTPLIKVVTKGLGEGLEVLGKQLGRIVTAFGPSVGTLFKGLETIFKGVADAFVAMAPGFQVAFKALAVGLKALRPAMKPLGEAFGDIMRAIAPFLPLIGRLLTDAVKALQPLLKPLVPVFQELAKAIGQLLPALEPTLKLLSRMGVQILKDLADVVIMILKDGIVPMIPVWADFLKAMRPVIRVGVQLLHALMPFIRVLLPPLLKLFGHMSTMMMQLLIPALNAMKDPLNWLADKLKAFGDAWRSFKQAFYNGLHIIGQWFIDLKDKVTGFFSNAWQWLLQAGRDIIQGLWDGITEKWDQFTGWLGDKVASLPGPIKHLLGIGSPSKVFRDIGRNITDGLVVGLGEGGAGVDRAMASIMGKVHGGGTMGFTHTIRGPGGHRTHIVGEMRIVGTKDLVAFIDGRVDRGVNDDHAMAARRQRARQSIGQRLDDR